MPIALPAGGIKYKITARADGFAESVSRQQTIDRVLDEIPASFFRFDEATETLSWNAVANAEKYFVLIECGDATHSHTNIDNKNITSYCIKECDPGQVKIFIALKADRWNSPTANVFARTKTKLATPKGGGLILKGIIRLLEISCLDGAKSSKSGFEKTYG